MKLHPLSSLALVLTVGAAFAACGNSSHAGGGAGDGGSGAGTDGGPTIMLTGGGPDGSTTGAIAITPVAPVLTVVSGQAVPTQQFSATVQGQPAVGVVWSIDQGALGSIDTNGKFTPTGTVGGVGNITASVGTTTGTTTITVNLQTTQSGDPSYTPNPGDAGAGGFGGVGGAGPGAPPTAAQTATLNGTPTADSTVSILYPYDGTVWPQGLLAPLLQWQPGAHVFDSVYVHIQEGNYEYKGYFGANAVGAFVNLPIPQAAWSAMAFSNTGGPVTVTLIFGQGGTAYGPYTETWTIAQAQLQGTIYYNSYGTALVKNSDSDDAYNQQYGAGTLAIAPGATAPTLVAGINSPGTAGTGCRVCHTVAANGQSLVTQASNSSANDYSQTVTINLANDTTAGAGTPVATPDLTFPALYKDGSLALSSAGGLVYPSTPALPTTSQLIALPGGTVVAGASGLPADLQAALPAFSPDGAHVSFNFWGGSFAGDGGAGLNSDQVSLAALDFDGTSVFSNPRVLYTPAAGTAVTYSSFFPNAAGIVFEVELTNPTGAWGYTWSNGAAVGNTGELWWLDVASGMAHRLDALNGYLPNEMVYLPSPGGTAPVHTPAQDATLNYEPTVNPIASGGYAWVVFTSRRMYGNVAQIGPWTSDPRKYAWADQVTDKKLWVAAVDLNGAPGTDPSHPAFYLPAQELHAGNARGYWTVEPCRADGQSCATGDQCCGGFCEAGPDGGLECTTQAPACSGLYDKCTTTSDCCAAGSGVECVNGVCTVAAPPK